ncbi:stage II sporulation protein D [Oscillospiraceae bacterium LTW-04]|nr:stage II sporulation protein D [Oscillospiraceae bacterium MB24-C1]
MRATIFFLVLLTLLTVAIPFVASLSGQGDILSFSESVPASEPASVSAVSSMAESVSESESNPSSAVTTVAPSDADLEARKSFKIFDRTTKKVFKVDAAEYIRGAVASEMPATFHQQALTAQAIAAHTWALYSAHRQAETPDPTLKGADFSADPERLEGYITKERFFERYGESAELFWPKICDAADYALTRIVTYNGKPALTAYHSTSAGQTEASDNVWTVSLPYLVPVESDGDLLAPDYKVTETYDKKTMKLLLMQAFSDVTLDDDTPEKWIVPLETSDSGYVTLAKVGDLEVHGQAVRNALSLRSGCFEISYQGGTFSVETLGYGHGVGMSQYGADFMARQGNTCEEILLHYYPNTEIKTVS